MKEKEVKKDKNKVKIFGLYVDIPAKECKDSHCPFHGKLCVRGNIFKGMVISKDIHKTAKVRWQRLYLVPKYERYEKRRTTIKVHNPPCIDAKIGDTVKIAECRPISKTKNFVIVGILGDKK